ncbi:esterase-like activity of phytase family protein [Sphingomonas tabacisoli]|uniref:Esterase-like activity of phytase family protein n=1 Tax=Sphingomonas tabacisoli TaxID=2249466 RepID=A0ABW4I3N0_9SPHN
MRRAIYAAVAATALLGTAAQANVILLAKGSIDGSSAGIGKDLSGLTGTLENGVAANILGGMGSALAYAGGTTFLATPDRGPNAVSYNSAVDDTTSYISRFQTLDLQLVQNAAGSPLPFSLSTLLYKTTLLSSPTALTYGTGAGLGLGSGAPANNTANTYYFTGRSDNFGDGNSGNPDNARFDPEGIRVSNDGNSVFVSDEYGPYVRQFDRRTGQLIKTFTLPANLDVANLSPKGDTEISGNTSGRVANKGMEGLAITPDGKTLVGIMQAPLIQDAADPATGKLLRIVTVDIATGATHEYGYNLTTGSGVSEIVALNDHTFLVDERDGKGLGDGSTAKVKQIFKIDIAGAADITNLTGAAAAAAAVAKPASPFLDVVATLGAAGVTGANVPVKIEGMAVGQDVTLNGTLYHTLFIANDNDFVPGVAGTNQFFVYGFTDADVPGFAAQQVAAIPEPKIWAMLIAGFGLIGAALRRRARTILPA